MKGTLGPGSVPGLLRELYVARRHGVIRFAKGDEDLSLRLRHGDIVSADSGDGGDRLGEFLVRRGMLAAEDKERALEAAAGAEDSFTETLVSMELMDRGDLEDAVAQHVVETLASVLTWEQGRFVFEEEAAIGEGGTLKMSTGALILEAVRAIEDPAIVTIALGDPERVLQPSTDPILRFQPLDLTPNDGFVLSRVDGTLSAREIEQLIPLPAEDVRKSLLGLVSTGAIEYADGSQRPSPEAEAAGADAAPSAAGNAAQAEPRSEAQPQIAAPPPSETPSESPSKAPSEPPSEPRPEPPPGAPPPRELDSSPETAAASEGELDSDTRQRRREIEEAFEALSARNHYEILGLERTAADAEIKEAYFSLAKRFHPDTHHDAALADLRDKLESVFIRLGQAYEVLRSRERRAEYEQRLGRPRPAAAAPGTGETTEARAATAGPSSEEIVARAEQLYAAARKAETDSPQKRGFWEAISLLEPIVNSLSDTLQLRAQMVLARAKMENPRWLREAEEILRKASRAHPKAVDPLLVLGELYERKSLRARATSMYRKVLDLRPADGRAIKALDRLREVPEEDDQDRDDGGSGLLKRIFGRK